MCDDPSFRIESIEVISNDNFPEENVIGKHVDVKAMQNDVKAPKLEMDEKYMDIKAVPS